MIIITCSSYCIAYIIGVCSLCMSVLATLVYAVEIGLKCVCFNLHKGDYPITKFIPVHLKTKTERCFKCFLL